MKRSEWVEQYAASLTSAPFVREFVFPNPQFTKKGLQKEVCDLLMVFHDQAIVVQMKTQEDPASRASAKLPVWIRKQAAAAAGQLSGTIRTLKNVGMWCDHSRRGRVEFADGTLKPVHGLVLIDCGPIRVDLPSEVPLSIHGVPVAYLDTNDFLNIVMQLRSFKDVAMYLGRRATLPEETRRSIGGERALLEHYMLRDASFENWVSFAEAEKEASDERPTRDVLFLEKQQRDVPASFVEYIADALAERLPTYTQDIDEPTRAMFDADENRHRYLEMQEVLAGLSLVARRQLGTGLLEVFGPPGTTPKDGCVYRALYLDDLPGFVFVGVATQGLPRQEVINRALVLLRGALSHFGWNDGMYIVDRDGTGFEIGLVRGYKPTSDDARIAERFFKQLRMIHRGEQLL
jgi:hypothetical protein